MAKIIAIFDVGSNGSKVRLDDGRTIEIQGHPSVGDEIFGVGPGGRPPVIPMTARQMNSRKQVEADVLSERFSKSDPTEGIT